MYQYIQKPLDWGVKLASLAVTGPATWQVAARLFSDIHSPALLFLMQFAAVFLVEGVLLSNWLLLEFDKQAAPEIKARYGLTALGMFVAMGVIAWEHEGPVGLVFRLALLAALVGSGWDTYVYTWQKATARVDRSVENSGKVRRHRRKAEIRIAKRQIDDWEQIERQRLELGKVVDSKALQLEQQRSLQQLEAVNRPAPAIRPARPKPVGRITRSARLDIGRVILAETPGILGPEFLRVLNDKLGARNGVSEATAYADLKLLRESLPQLMAGNGNGHGSH